MSKQVKIILFSCMYILGIITFFTNYTLIISSLILSILCFCFYKKFISLKIFILLSCIFCTGIANSAFNINYDDDLTSYSDEKVTVKAKVLTIPSNNKVDSTVFFAKISEIKDFDGSTKHIQAKSRITVNDDSERLKKIKIGDSLILTGKVKTPLYAQNPSQFDYAKYLQYKNTFSLIYVNDNWQLFKHADNFLGRVISKLNDIRVDIIGIHARNIKSPMLEILGGIIFGDDAVNPDEDTKTNFINSGIFHILAASGMNVTLIFGIWFFLASAMRLNYKVSIFSGMALILFYTCMTGFGAPIVRAFLMLFLILTGKLIDRKTPTMALLFLVAFLMLLYSPLMIFDIGFQLSFIVTFALILTAPLLVFNFKYKYVNYILSMCIVPIIAQIYAAPLQMYYFNTFALYSVLANIAIIPVLSIVSFLGFISSIIALIQPIAHKVCYLADLILNPLLVYITKVASTFSDLPYSVLYVAKPSGIQLFLYFSLIIFVTVIIRYKLFFKRTCIILSVLILCFILTFIPISNNKAEIMFFSVQNADEILIKSPKNEYFIIDTGKYSYFSSQSQAQNTIIKYLRDKGIKNINSLIITHFDADHAGGTVSVLKDLNVKNLFLTDIYENTLLTDNIQNYLIKNNVEYVTVDNMLKIYEEDDFVISIVKPKGENIKSENQNSLIVNLKYKNNNVLFMGDGDINSFDVLPEEFKRNITLMKSGHHGAKNTISQEMADNTEIFVISTGFNFYNHPHPQTLEMLKGNNKKYLRTDYHNAVKFILDEENYKIYTFSPKNKKFLLFNL